MIKRPRSLQETHLVYKTFRFCSLLSFLPKIQVSPDMLTERQ